MTRSPEEYWELMSEHVSLAAAALRHADEPAREGIRAVAIANVRPYERNGKIRVPGVARCIVGTKPAADAPPTSGQRRPTGSSRR